MTWKGSIPNDLYLVALVGKIASGKSTIARGLAEALGLELVRGRMLIENKLRSRDLPITEQNMQDVGHELISSMGGYEFTLQVLRICKTKEIVYDSFRNVSEVIGLRRELEKRLIVVYLDIDVEERKQRFTQRLGRENTVEAFDARSGHEVESEIDKIRPLSDILIKSAPISDQLEKVSIFVREVWGD